MGVRRGVARLYRRREATASHGASRWRAAADVWILGPRDGRRDVRRPGPWRVRQGSLDCAASLLMTFRCKASRRWAIAVAVTSSMIGQGAVHTVVNEVNYHTFSSAH